MTEPTTTGNARAHLATAVRVLVVAAIVVTVALAVRSQWADVRDTITTLGIWSLIGATFFVFLGMGSAVRAWQHALGSLHFPIPAFDAARCYLVGQLAKYLPGSVWAFVLQAELVRRAGVTRAAGFTAVLVTVGLSTTSALVVGLLALPALFHLSSVAAIGVLCLVPISLICAYPAVLTRLVNVLLRLLRLPPLTEPLTRRKIALALGWCATSWVFYGIHLWILTSNSVGLHPAGLVQCIGALALGMCAGVLVFVAPSGIGVREAVVVAALSPFMPSGVALGLALASRLIFTLCEVVAGAAAAALTSASLRNRLVHSRSRTKPTGTLG
ncbi:lysylphosphatidylglycerol synthase transmembrane domain-containing protein [Rhodococcoides kroppenstedtii]|uniref:lysylphosphatidylglycerol synthase transmembrane domain-containing protein n=1 Tax=Rhodococcoides kroppenstedtii TaxID=293050 RepID=UPI0028EB0089|nr:lysylphosphatidylglycerol synthase domain-containing protein [Rhodococcus kroppenstedtii]